MKRTYLAVALLFAAALPSQAAALQTSAPRSADLGVGADSIRAQDLRAHIGFLASDELQGREAGTMFSDIAACYVASEFQRIGLEPVCEGGKSWFQPFTFGKKSSRNVLGLIPGTDAKLKEEVIVIGAHYDHVGLGKFGSTGGITKEDSIHNGADDNASGTAGILELAEAFARQPAPRSLLFIAFSAEEHGLLGSQAYVDEPVIPLEKTVAMLNFDMIGRSQDDYLFIGGVGTSDAWPALIEKHIKPAGFALETNDGGRAPSDNTSFYNQKLPVLFFFTNLHEDYHRPGDHVDKIQFEAEVKILRSAYALIRDLAASAQAPAFRKSDGVAMPKDFMKKLGELMRQPAAAKDMAKEVTTAAKERAKEAAESRSTKPKLGVSLGGGESGRPVFAEKVVPGGNAEASGLKAGDTIVSIDGKAVTDVAVITDCLAAKKNGDAVKLRIKRGDAESELEVQLK